MSIVRLEAISPNFAKNQDGSNKIIEVDFDEDRHCCGSNRHNWCNLIELTTEETGGLVASWKEDVSKMMTGHYNILEII